MKTLIIVLTGSLIFPTINWADTPSKKFQLTSPAFENNAGIPTRYTCDGGDVNPPLIFKNVPPHTKSLALTVSDPDAPEGLWSQWVVYNIPPNVGEIIENTNPGTEGLSDFGKYVYAGPCPSDDKLHHYIFRAFALNNFLYINEGPTLGEVEHALRSHTITKTELIGTYQKSPI